MSRTANRSAPPLPNAFDPYDDALQPAMQVEGYKETFTRTPTQPPYRRPLTLTEITGPLNLKAKLRTGNNDLSRASERAPRAMGQLIYVTGRLLDEDAAPIRDSVIEIWHANAGGRYAHPADAHNPAPLDPNFIGSGRTVTDHEGRYRFLTIKPGAYPVPDHATRWWRPPHIHLSIFGEGFMSRLVTQMFFPGDPLNELDLIRNAVPDPKGRERMTARAIPMMDMPMVGVLGFEHDLVVRGRRQTPFGV